MSATREDEHEPELERLVDYARLPVALLECPSCRRRVGGVRIAGRLAFVSLARYMVLHVVSEITGEPIDLDAEAEVLTHRCS